MVQIPVSKPVFTTLQDQRDDIKAEDQNIPNDEIEAIIDMLGINGIAQSKSREWLDSLANMIAPSMRLTYVDGDTVKVSAGRIWCKDATGSIRVLRYNATETDVTFANIDTGSEASSTVYYVLAIADAVATTVTFVVSTSASAPSGATVFGLVGKFYNNSASDVEQLSVSSECGIKILQVQEYNTGAESHGSGTIAVDTSTPQITEGNQVMPVSGESFYFTPQKATSKLKLEFLAIGSSQVDGSYIVASLFFEGTDDAKFTEYEYQTYGSNPAPRLLKGEKTIASPGITPIGISVRMGGTSGTFTFNGHSSNPYFNLNLSSLIRITEFE